MMKKYLLLFLFAAPVTLLYAQSVGVGTTTPNTSAQLDITSTTKGLLIPRMTTVRRNAIALPANGLLVYDSTIKEFYFYNGSGWAAVNSGSSGGNDWVASGNNIYNSNTGNVGIGRTAPFEKLDVGGNIRSRDNVIVDSNVQVKGRVDADGVIGGAGLTGGVLYITNTSLMEGALTGNSSASFYGNINSYTGMSIANAAGILQFSAGGDEKGFVQLSGDNLRIGTNSSNTAGNFIVRTGGSNNLTITSDGRTGIGVEEPLAKLHINSGASNAALRLQADFSPSLQFYSGATSIGSIQGSFNNLNILAPGNRVNISNVLYADDASNRVGIGTIAPEQKLHVIGSAKITGEKILNNSNENMLPIAYGKFSETGNKQAGTSNISAVAALPGSEAEYFIVTVAGVDLSNAVAQVTSGNNYISGRMVSVKPYPDDTTKLQVDLRYDGEGIHSPFHIIIYKAY
jgi:hypothetical protein